MNRRHLEDPEQQLASGTAVKQFSNIASQSHTQMKNIWFSIFDIFFFIHFIHVHLIVFLLNRLIQWMILHSMRFAAGIYRPKKNRFDIHLKNTYVPTIIMPEMNHKKKFVVESSLSPKSYLCAALPFDSSVILCTKVVWSYVQASITGSVLAPVWSVRATLCFFTVATARVSACDDWCFVGTLPSWKPVGWIIREF